MLSIRCICKPHSENELKEAWTSCQHSRFGRFPPHRSSGRPRADGHGGLPCVGRGLGHARTQFPAPLMRGEKELLKPACPASASLVGEAAAEGSPTGTTREFSREKGRGQGYPRWGQPSLAGGRGRTVYGSLFTQRPGQSDRRWRMEGSACRALTRLQKAAATAQKRATSSHPRRKATA